MTVQNIPGRNLSSIGNWVVLQDKGSNREKDEASCEKRVNLFKGSTMKKNWPWGGGS